AEDHNALHKGAWLRDADLTTLRMLDVKEVTVAMLEPGDVHEDAAAARLAAAATGGGVVQNDASGGRVNLMSAVAGLLKVNLDALRQVNLIDGLTVATLRHDTV